MHACRLSIEMVTKRHPVGRVLGTTGGAVGRAPATAPDRRLLVRELLPERGEGEAGRAFRGQTSRARGG